MFKKILLPLDGSPSSRKAVPYATALAHASGGTIVLLQAAHPHAQPFSAAHPYEVEVEAIDAAEVYVNLVAEKLAKEGIAVETAVAYGTPAECILDEIEIRKADVVVMATHARTGVNHLVAGSVAETVLAHSGIPMLLVRGWHADPDPGFLKGNPRLLVPLDGSTYSELALPVAQELATALQGSLTLAHVVVPPESVLTGPDGTIVAYVDQQESSLENEAEQYLKGLARRVAADAPRVAVTRDVRVGNPTDSIAAAAEEYGASLVVMATHGRTGLARLLLGSVAGGVLRHGTVPLLLVHPGQLAGATQTIQTAQPAIAPSV